MTSKKDERSKQPSTTPKKVVLVRPPLDFEKPPEEQEEAIEEFCRSVAKGLRE